MKFALIPLAALSCSATVFAEAPKFITDLLPLDVPVKAERGRVFPPPELDKYVAKVRQAALKDQEWFREHSKNGKPGVPLPYDERLGLTKEEYDEYLKLWNKREFKAEEPVVILVKGDKDGRWTLNMSGSAQSLSTLKYDPKDDAFHSPNGTLKRIEDVTADADSTLGAWSGQEWRFQEESSLSITKENIAVGKTGDKKYGLVVYRFQEVSSQNTPLADSGMVIRFPLGASGVAPEAKPKPKPAVADKPAPAKPAPKPAAKPKKK
ncbi:hypothetical protein [Luteolibacter sp. Populi]|uniref:hypothetical protein n=1 Tax=Luteolibacter sp. Populi TaxID=3230487 RepID=UPI00346617D8